MSIFTLTETEFDRDCRWLFETVTTTLDKIAKLLTESEVTVTCAPKYLAGFVVPYYFAGQLRLLFEYARGNKQLSSQLVEEITLKYYRMMSMSPFSTLNAVDDDDDDDDETPVNTRSELSQALELIESLRPHPISIIILGAHARTKLDANKWLSAGEMHALTELTPDRAEAFKIRTRTNDDDVVEFNPEDIRRVLNLRDT